MKIVLVALNATYGHTNLAVRYLDAYFRRHSGVCPGAVIQFMEFSINDAHERILDALYEEHADLYGFSCYIWNIGHILEITSDLKQIFPGSTIVLGGPEVSYEKAGFLDSNPQADYLIQGPGMKSFTDLVIRLNARRTSNGGSTADRTDSSGSAQIAEDGAEAAIDDGRIIRGEPVCLDELEFPYQGIDAFLPDKQYYYETSTGCPYRCSYCLSSAQTGVDVLAAARVRDDLDAFIAKGAGIVKLVDRTFNFEDRRAAQIWAYLIDQYRIKPFETIFHFEIAADLLRDETLQLLSTAPKGIFRFECGVQSTDSGVLGNVDRKTDQDRLFRALHAIAGYGNIELHVDLIAGLPGESLAIFRRSFNDVFRIYPDMLQLGFLKMLKGSKIREDADRFGIVSSSYPPYMVIRTDALTFGNLSLLKKLEKVLDIFYNSGQFRYSVRYLIERTSREDPFSFINRLAEAYQEAGGFVRTVSRKDRIVLFYRFGSGLLAEPARTGEDSFYDKEAAHSVFNGPSSRIDIFTDLMKFDYYRFDKKGSIPELKMNLSESHPMMSREASAAFMCGSDGNPLCRKGRIERYSFDAQLLVADNRVVPGCSFVLYDLSGDRPAIKKTLNVN